jgi:phosphate-selective porin OprO/OprP
MYRGQSGGQSRLLVALAAGLLAAVLVLSVGSAQAQSAEVAPAGSPEGSVNADEGNPDEPTRRMVHWNEYEGPWFTARLGGGFLYDTANYSQDADSKSQFDLEASQFIRDSRLIMKGRLKFSPRLHYTIGYMYDSDDRAWFWRQTGLIVDMPEWGGDIFIGRTKEGFSMNKIMNGYSGWTNERATANDSFIPILADGVQVRGSVADHGIAWNVGIYDDKYTDSESFNKNDNQFVARGVWQPLHGRPEDEILHLGLAYRYGTDNGGGIQYKSRPESFSASPVIDTGVIPANHAQTIGLETYYQAGPLFLGGEYFLNQVSSPQTGDPFLHGGELMVTWLTGGERRPYNAKTGVFGGIVTPNSVFDGGRGTWEFVARFSYTDLDDGPIEGGTFWRITPMVNWHMSANVRLEFVYGYGVLDRFDTKGGTHFFQTRIQLQL